MAFLLHQFPRALTEIRRRFAPEPQNAASDRRLAHASDCLGCDYRFLRVQSGSGHMTSFQFDLSDERQSPGKIALHRVTAHPVGDCFEHVAPYQLASALHLRRHRLQARAEFERLDGVALFEGGDDHSPDGDPLAPMVLVTQCQLEGSLEMRKRFGRPAAIRVEEADSERKLGTLDSDGAGLAEKRLGPRHVALDKATVAASAV
jgi:hypothetical protein